MRQWGAVVIPQKKASTGVELLSDLSRRPREGQQCVVVRHKGNLKTFSSGSVECENRRVVKGVQTYSRGLHTSLAVLVLVYFLI